MPVRAYLIGIQHPWMAPGDSGLLLAELEELLINLGRTVVGHEIVHLKNPTANFLVGLGKVDAIIATARAAGAQQLVFDDELSPAQQRNWERALSQDAARHETVDVTDRQEVILDIFAARARTREAVLQVELAQLNYYLPRLRRAWTHLSRQRGGGTGARGQGETQLEVDRRYVRDRIAKVGAELQAVVRQREQSRRKRQRNAVPSAAIVGYTNAGKSTLLNLMTGAGVLAEDKLFATLDPTTRQLILPARHKVLLTDTVGFIRRLPTRLVEAFKATLEETVLADFLIHVVDVSSPQVEHHLQTTLDVLAEIGAAGKRTLLVFNKLDRVQDPFSIAALRSAHPEAHFVSCRDGTGIDGLLQAIAREVDAIVGSASFLIPHNRYDLVARLHELGCVRHTEQQDQGVWIDGVLPPSLAGALAPFVVRNGTG